MVVLMTMVLVQLKVVLSELRSMVRRRGVAWVLMVEAEAYRRRVVVMVVLIWRGVLWKRAVLGTLGLEVSLGGVV